MHPLLVSRKLIIVALVMLPIYGVGLYAAWLSHPSIAAENALMENIQAGCLALACVLFIPCLAKKTTGFSRFACWSLCLVMGSMFLREVDVEVLAVPGVVAWFGSGLGRDLIVGSAFVVTFIILVRRRYELVGELIEYAFSGIGVLLALGALLYVSSLPFDKSWLGLSTGLNQFCEEAVECGATFMFLMAATLNLVQYLHARNQKPVVQPASIPSSRIAA